MTSIPGAAGPGSPFPQWVYNTVSHQVAEVPDAVAKAGAEAATWPDKLIFFTSDHAAYAYMISQGGGLDTSHTPIQSAANAVSGVGQTAVNAARSLPTGLAAIGDFFNKLGDPATWIRVVKVAFGGVLLIIGLAHITGSDHVIAQTARKAPLPI